MIQGYPKFTGLALGEFTMNRMAATVKIVAKVAFIDPNSGATYGWSSLEGSVWSTQTLEKLAELVQSMEEDAVKVLFEKDTVQGSTTDPAPSGPVGGLGEHLGGDAPSV